MESFVEWGEELAKRELKTNIELGVGDLLAYRVNEVVDLTVNFKELKVGAIKRQQDSVHVSLNYMFAGCPNIF